MHADGAVDAVVDDDDDDRQVILHGGGEFLAVHQEAAVAGKADHLAIGKQPLGRDRRRRAVAHRAGSRRALRGEAAEAMVAVYPGGVVAGTIGQDRVFRQHLFQIGHDRPHLHRAGSGFGRCRPCEIVRMRGGRGLRPTRR
ncbi:hypothetical protein D9M69_653830 [compost metagenome]